LHLRVYTTWVRGKAGKRTPSKRREAEQLRAEIVQDLHAISDYEAKHGSFAEMVRAHYERDD